MMKALSSFVVVILSLLPIVDGSSLLRYQDGSAYCQGNLTNLTFVSATCPDTEYGCTWGSTASLFVQGKRVNDGNEKRPCDLLQLLCLELCMLSMKVAFPFLFTLQ